MNKLKGLDYYCDNHYSKVEIIGNNKKEIRETETYGTETYKITDKDIEALKKGKLLVVFPYGEYTCLFKYERVNK